MSDIIKFIIKTGGIGQKEGVLVIRENQITFARRTIRIEDVLSVSSSLSHRNDALTSTINSRISVHGSTGQIDIKLSASNFLGMGKAEKIHQSYLQIRDAIIQFAAPPILGRLVAQICNGLTVRIGNLSFDLRGVTGRNLLGTELCAAWTSFPEIRYVTRTAWFSNAVKGECMEVFFHSRSTGKMITIGSISHDDENGCFVPLIISMLTRLVNQGK